MALRVFVSRAAKSAHNLVVAFAFVAIAAAGVSAQATGTVTGLVRDATTLEPLAGAQVSIEGTGIGGLVNNVGRYLLLNVPAGSQTVIVTLIGFSPGEETLTVTSGGTATADFGLHEQALSLEGVIVTGTAGQARRREVGNVIEQVSSGDIAMAAIVSFSDVLQGRAAGLQIGSTDGQVGSGSAIRIRGNASLTQSNMPLIYLDGVRIETDPLIPDDEAGAAPSLLDGINPADIDRIEIIKGPAATTLYGTEAAGGVIQIFTKRGSAGAPAWTFTYDGSRSQMGHQGPSHASQVTSMSNGWTLDPDNAGTFPDGTFDVDYLLDGEINENGLRLNDCAMGGTNPGGDYGAEPGCPDSGSWFRDAYMQRVNLNVRGGGETSTYFVSARFGDADGVVDPQGEVTYNVRANIQFQPAEGLDISLNNMYTRRNTTWIPNGNNASGLFLNVLRGTRGYTPGNDDSLVLVNDIVSYINQWVTSLSVGWSPSQSFSHRLNVGMDYSYVDFVDFKPYGNYENPTGDRENDTRTNRNLTFDYNGSFRYDVTDGISSGFSWGGQLYEEYTGRLNGFDEEFAGPGEQLLGGGTLPGIVERRLTIRSGGFFLQEQLGLGDRFFLTIGNRWDGFSTFGEGVGLASYPKLSAAYTVSEESFFPQIDAIDALKLRTAWGKSGRAPGAFDAVRIYEATQADEFVPAVIIGNLGNADLGPEVSEEIEAGFELSMYGGRFGVDFTWYNQKTLDALIGVQEAPSFGTEERTLRNLGETKTWGTEISVNMVPVRTDNIEWSVNVSYATNDSEIVDMGPLTNLGYSLRVGQPIRVEYDQVLKNPSINGETPDYHNQALGVLWPTKLFSIGTRLTINQSLTLDILGEGQGGHIRTVGLGWATVRRETWPHCFGILSEWNANGATNLNAQQIGTCVPAHVSWGMWTDRADFFKIRSATLSYRLPEGWVPRTRNVTVSLQGKGLFTQTDYQGLDPETYDSGFGRGAPFEYYNMGQPKVLIFNVRVNF